MKNIWRAIIIIIVININRLDDFRVTSILYVRPCILVVDYVQRRAWPTNDWLPPSPPRARHRQHMGQWLLNLFFYFDLVGTPTTAAV